jgi:hypothetical protein
MPLLTCQLPVLYNHNMCNNSLYYQSKNTDFFAETFTGNIHYVSLLSLIHFFRDPT